MFLGLDSDQAFLLVLRDPVLNRRLFSGTFQGWYPVLEITVMLYILFPGVPLELQG